MGATVQTVQAVLKSDYRGPVRDQINYEAFMVQLFAKASVDWNGKNVIVPVHVAGNAGVFVTPDGGTFFAAGQQQLEDYTLTSKYIYGRFQFTGPTLKSMNGPNAFVNAIGLEMKTLVKDVKKIANLFMFCGNKLLGFIHERKVGANPATWQLSGNLADRFAVQTPFGGGNTATVNIIRCDTYATYSGNLAWSAMNTTLNTITLAALDTTFATTGMASGIPMAVSINTMTRTYNDAAGVAVNLESGIIANQPAGIYQNLASQTHFGLSRSGAGTLDILKSKIRSMAIGGAGADANYVWTALSQARMQAVLDEVSLAVGDDEDQVDLILMRHDLRQAYTQVFAGSVPPSPNYQILIGDGPKANADAGFKVDGFSFNGIPIKCSQSCGPGIIIFLATKTWKLYELCPGEFADDDGNVLSRIANTDNWEGFYRWFYELMCERPAANALLCGVTFPAVA